MCWFSLNQYDTLSCIHMARVYHIPGERYVVLCPATSWPDTEVWWFVLEYIAVDAGKIPSDSETPFLPHK